MSAFAFLFDAAEVRQCPQFKTSSAALEHDCFTAELYHPLNAYGQAFGPYETAYDTYDKTRPFFNDDEGLTVDHPYLQNLEKQGRAAHDAFDKALGRLDDAVTDEVICCLAEGLGLVGVTDPATVFEVCRVVIRGGVLWDGKGFTPGEAPVSVEPSTAETSRECPHCGLPSEAGESRCSSCERVIG